MKPVPVACALSLKDYREIVTPGKIRNKIGSAYVLCAGECLVFSGKWATRNSYTEPIQYVFDAGHKLELAICTGWERLTIPHNHGSKHKNKTLGFPANGARKEAAGTLHRRHLGKGASALARNDPGMLAKTDPALHQDGAIWRGQRAKHRFLRRGKYGNFARSRRFRRGSPVVEMNKGLDLEVVIDQADMSSHCDVAMIAWWWRQAIR